MKFTSTCTCGEVMTVDAATKEEALEKMKGIMNADAITKHMAEKHVGQPVPTLEQAHMMLAQTVVAAV